MTWLVQIDPAGAMLDLNDGPIKVDQAGIDWGQAATTPYETQQGQWGNSVSDKVYPNRTITLPLALGMDGSDGEIARSRLQQKVARLQDEGGVLKRQRAAGPVMYADIVNATLTVPDVWGATAGGLENAVSLVLECLPDFYGDEITLDPITATGVCTAVLAQSSTTAIIGGDYRARCRIKVTDTSGGDQLAAIWGIRSRRYDSAATAALRIDAETLTPLDSAAVASHSGFYNGSGIKHPGLSPGQWTPVLSTNPLAGGQLTHQGSYQVWARAYSATGTPQLRLMWGVGDVAHYITNSPADSIPLSAYAFLVNLGAITVAPSLIGTSAWTGVVQAYAQYASPIEIDCLFFVPVDEGAGQVYAVQQNTVFGINATGYPSAATNIAGGGTFVWSGPASVYYQDGQSAVAGTQATGGLTQYLAATGFGFNIPSGAKILGIEAAFIRRQAGGQAHDAYVQLIKAGTVQTTAANRADTTTPWIARDQYVTYGGVSDLWGATWTPADINNTGFGVALAVTLAAQSQALVDAVSITVTYTQASSAFATSEDAVVYANSVAELRTEGMYREAPSGAWGPIAQQIGDLPRLPPSGLEDRPVELLVKPCRAANQSNGAISDNTIDTFTVQVSYRPCYLGRP